MTWSQGSAKKFNLTTPQLDQLYNILIWAEPGRLQELTMSLARDAIKMSKFPNLLAQARSLTRVTLLSGADNHTMRILGISCPFLKFLDVSHSIHVNDVGLQHLILKKLVRKRIVPPGEPQAENDPLFNVNVDNSTFPTNVETNPCAQSLVCITLLGTSITWEGTPANIAKIHRFATKLKSKALTRLIFVLKLAGCDYACEVMNSGYLCSSLPLIKIFRLDQSCLVEKGVSLRMIRLGSIVTDGVRQQVSAAVNNTLVGAGLDSIVFDCYKVSQSAGQASLFEQNKLQILVRDTISYRLSMYMKMDSNSITTLVLPWYTFTWRVDSLVDLDTLGNFFPNLQYLRGRVKGIWNGMGNPFLPNLEVAYVWSLNSSTGLSILANVQSLRVLEFNNTRTMPVADPSMNLNDTTLEQCLTTNATLAETIEEFTIRPTKLTVKSLRTLLEKCPKIKRIGDLEAWNIRAQEIGDFNKHLDSIRSQCILTVMNFPPTSREKYENI